MTVRAPPGRRSDLDALASVLEPPYGVAVLGGEAGMGKADLAAGFRQAAAERGWLSGSARVGGAGEPSLAPLVGALMDALSGLAERGEILASLAPWAGPREARLPVLSEHLAVLPEDAVRWPASPWEAQELDRLRGLEAVAQALQAAARVRPLALVISGTEGARPLLFDYLAYVLPLVAEVPLAFVLVVEGMDGLEASFDRLRRSTEGAGSRWVEVRLGPLDPIALEEILKARYPEADFAPPFVGRVLKAAHGSPGRLGEVCRKLEEAGALFREGGQWLGREPDPWPIPEGLADYRLAPMLDLAPADFEFLELLALAGRIIPDRLVSDPRLAGYLGTGERALLKGVSRLAKLGLLEPAPGGWRIPDASLQTALREEADPLVRKRDAGVLAGALAATQGADPMVVARLAEAAGELAAAAGALSRAADALEAEGAFGAAASALGRAREIQVRLGAEGSFEERVEGARREGHAWQLARYHDEALEAYARGLVTAEMLELPLKVAGLRCRRGWCLLAQGRAAEAETEFTEAREAASGADAPGAVRLAILGLIQATRALGRTDEVGVLRTVAGEAEDQLEPWLEFETALAQAQAGDREGAEELLIALVERWPANHLVVARSLVALAELHEAAGRDELALSTARTAVDRSRKAGDPRTLLAALELVGRSTPDSGAERRVTRRMVYALAARLEEPRAQLAAALELGGEGLAEGRTEEAGRLLAQAQRLAKKLGRIGDEARAELLLGTANLTLNKLYEAQADFENASKKCQTLGDAKGGAEAMLGLGRVYLAQRKGTRAKELIAKARDAFKALGLPEREAACAKLLSTP